MKLYTHKKFLQLPAGVLYCSGEKWCFGELSVKGETVANGKDFLSLGLTDIESFDLGENIARLSDMLENGASYPMQETYGRDGLFDDGAIYLVYEPTDLAVLMAICRKAFMVMP